MTCILAAMHKAAQPEFATALATWFRKHRRRLPWREKPSLYKTVVSEFMLQQTQVSTVLPYFERWLERFPDFTTLAAADEANVLKAWEGLGYYRRARNLHALAHAYTTAPKKPDHYTAWLQMPGIGPYTAAAIASIAHGETVPVVDGNVVRVITRLRADSTTYPNNAAAVKACHPHATALLHPCEPGLHNEAMMELGATLCTRSAPKCHACPGAPFCKATRTGHPECYPHLGPRKSEAIERHLAWIEHDGALLLERKDARANRLAGLWELPTFETLGKHPPRKAPLETRTRGISHQRIREHLHRLRATPTLLKTISEHPQCRLVPLSELDTLTLSGPHRKWVHARLNEQA